MKEKLRIIIKNKYFILFICGLLSALAFAPTYLFPFLFLGFFVLLKTLEDAKNKKEAFFIGWFFAWGHFIGGLYWICISLLVDPLKFAWLIPFAISLIPAALSIYIGLAILILFILKKKFDIKNRFLLVLIFAFLWMMTEIIRANFFIPFIWNPIANIWAFSNTMIQIDYIIKIYIFGFITIILFSSLYVFVEFFNGKLKFNIKNNIKYLIFYFILFFSIFFYGFFRLKNVNTDNQKIIKVKVIQPNIKQDLKWDRDRAMEHLQTLIDMSNEGENADYIIWPESAIPFLVSENSKNLLTDIHSKIKNQNAILITGGVRGNIIKGELKNIWNSVLVLQKGEVLDYYDKINLVPFGEYVPLKNFIPFVKKITGGNVDFSRGKERNVVDIDNIFPKTIFLICYEIVFPDLKIKEKPSLIINITNDGWFGNSSGPYQHLDYARMRAVENKISIIRVANSGITAYINKYGEVVYKIPLNIKKEMVLDLII